MGLGNRAPPVMSFEQREELKRYGDMNRYEKGLTEK